MKHNKRWLGAGMMILVTGMLTGCWDSVEVNNRSVLLEFALDKNNDYEYDPNTAMDEQQIYRLTYSIPDFGKISGTESLATDMEATTEVEAASIAASIDDIEIQNKDTVTFSHVKTLFLGEALLQDRMLFKQAIDAISRDMLIARNVPLLAVNGEAKLTAAVEDSIQPILGLYILDYFNNKERPVSYFKKQLLGNFIREIEETGVATLPIFHVEELEQQQAEQEAKAAQEKGGSDAKVGGVAEGASSDPAADSSAESASTSAESGGGAPAGEPIQTDKIDISGAAVIQDYELVGYLSKEEVRGQLHVQGEVKNTPVVGYYNDNPITYTIKEETSEVRFEDTEEGPICFIEIETKGDISEYLSAQSQDLMDPESLQEIRKVLAQSIIDQTLVGVRRAKEMNVDFIGLGLEMYRMENELWDKYKSTWYEGVFETLPVEVGVKVVIESTGIKE